MRINVIIILMMAFFLATSDTSYSQEEVFKVPISYEQTSEKTSKKNLLKIKKWYMIINNDEIEFQYCEEDGFIFPKITDEQLMYLEKRDDVLIKLKDKKRCYMGLLPSYELLNSYKQKPTSHQTTISSFIMYKSGGKIILHFYFVHRLSEEQIRQIKEIEARGKIPLGPHVDFYTNLRLIPCKDYKGEYDEGYGQYELK